MEKGVEIAMGTTTTTSVGLFNDMNATVHVQKTHFSSFEGIISRSFCLRAALSSAEGDKNRRSDGEWKKHSCVRTWRPHSVIISEVATFHLVI